jgi:type 1 glutamine amidotransferase
VSAPRLLFTSHVAPYAAGGPYDGPAGVHGVLPQAASAMAELAGLHGLEPVIATDVVGLEPGLLAEGGVLSLFTIGETPWSEAQRGAIVEAVHAGTMAVLGVHSATDASRGWPDYGRLLGARFDGHPWTATVELEVDTDHPATSHWPSRMPWHDEVYLFKDLRPDARVLIRVAEGQLDMTVPDARTPACGFPLAWCFEEGAGPCFYSALGHFSHAWEQPAYLRHLDGALGWLLDGLDRAGRAGRAGGHGGRGGPGTVAG